MSCAPLSDARQRALEDMLESERNMRHVVEGSVRDLRKVLLETALRLDGSRFEELRRDDPSVPGKWSASDWRSFMASISRPAAWLDTEDWDRQKRELAQQIEGLKTALANAERMLAEQRTQLEEAGQNAAAATPAATTGPIPRDGMTQPLAVLLEHVRKAIKDAPDRAPAAFANVLDGGGRTGGDRARVWPRYWTVLYLVGYCQVSAMMEIEVALAESSRVSAGSGSMKRVMDDLLERNLLEIKLLSCSSPNTKLKVVRLTADGERLTQTVFGREIVENDWMRMVRLHEGDRFEEHTLAVLAFAMHARRRGWATRILPEVEGHAKPDLCVADTDTRRYVEVELSRKENTSKWRNLAELNGGAVALCAGTMEGRTRLVGDCKLLKLQGAATDLESLINTRYKTAQSSLLWLEVW